MIVKSLSDYFIERSNFDNFSTESIDQVLSSFLANETAAISANKSNSYTEDIISKALKASEGSTSASKNEESSKLSNTISENESKSLRDTIRNLYMSSEVGNDGYYRLGNIISEADDYINIFGPEQSLKAGQVECKEMYSLPTKSYAAVDTISNMKINIGGDTYMNLNFPPFNYTNNAGSSLTNSDLTANSTFSNISKITGPARTSTLTYRSSKFKTVNDNINFLQYVLEKTTGIVSTYLTEWDLSLYFQENLYANEKDPVTKKPKTFIDGITHGMDTDYPQINGESYIGNDTSSESILPFGVLNAALSLESFNPDDSNYINEEYWSPSKYYLSKNWTSVIDGNKKENGYTNENKNRPFDLLPDFYTEVEDKGWTSPKSVDDILKFYDKVGAVHAGWTNRKHIPYYSTLYTSAGTNITALDDAHAKESKYTYTWKQMAKMSIKSLYKMDKSLRRYFFIKPGVNVRGIEKGYHSNISTGVGISRLSPALYGGPHGNKRAQTGLMAYAAGKYNAEGLKGTPLIDGSVICNNELLDEGNTDNFFKGQHSKYKDGKRSPLSCIADLKNGKVNTRSISVNLKNDSLRAYVKNLEDAMYVSDYNEYKSDINVKHIEAAYVDVIIGDISSELQLKSDNKIANASLPYTTLPRLTPGSTKIELDIGSMFNPSTGIKLDSDKTKWPNWVNDDNDGKNNIYWYEVDVSEITKNVKYQVNLKGKVYVKRVFAGLLVTYDGWKKSGTVDVDVPIVQSSPAAWHFGRVKGSLFDYKLHLSDYNSVRYLNNDEVKFAKYVLGIPDPESKNIFSMLKNIFNPWVSCYFVVRDKQSASGKVTSIIKAKTKLKSDLFNTYIKVDMGSVELVYSYKDNTSVSEIDLGSGAKEETEKTYKHRKLWFWDRIKMNDKDEIKHTITTNKYLIGEYKKSHTPEVYYGYGYFGSLPGLVGKNYSCYDVYNGNDKAIGFDYKSFLSNIYEKTAEGSIENYKFKYADRYDVYDSGKKTYSNNPNDDWKSSNYKNYINYKSIDSNLQTALQTYYTTTTFKNNNKIYSVKLNHILKNFYKVALAQKAYYDIAKSCFNSNESRTNAKLLYIKSIDPEIKYYSVGKKKNTDNMNYRYWIEKANFYYNNSSKADVDALFDACTKNIDAFLNKSKEIANSYGKSDNVISVFDIDAKKFKYSELYALMNLATKALYDATSKSAEIEKVMLSYLNLLYEHRRYFINKRFNKKDGTMWRTKVLLDAYNVMESDKNHSADTIDNPDLVETTYDDHEYSVKLCEGESATRTDLSPLEIIEAQDTDRVVAIYITAKEATEEEYESYINAENKNDLQRIVLCEKNNKYYKVPYDGIYSLTSKELLQVVEAKKHNKYREEEELDYDGSGVEYDEAADLDPSATIARININWLLNGKIVAIDYNDKNKEDKSFKIGSSDTIRLILGVSSGIDPFKVVSNLSNGVSPLDAICSGNIDGALWRVPIKMDRPLVKLMKSSAMITTKLVNPKLGLSAGGIFDNIPCPIAYAQTSDNATVSLDSVTESKETINASSEKKKNENLQKMISFAKGLIGM